MKKKISQKEFYGCVEEGIGEGLDFDQAFSCAYDCMKAEYGQHVELQLPYNEKTEARLRKLAGEEA
ncbi:hypothetical protein [Burkholderia plantarii]|uniref:hypothetical protein n=1 Tax=Burkholderia plantarii TaxID=41899 RepID=UPI00114CB9FD|nr:hypothetical protein [Burkholderia plantarii]